MLLITQAAITGILGKRPARVANYLRQAVPAFTVIEQVVFYSSERKAWMDEPCSTTRTEPVWSRYQRHLQLPGFGVPGQRALLDARVLLVGAGGLGCPVGIYLAASGVGEISVVDSDRVELSNLHRQIAFSTAEIGNEKAPALVERMRQINADLHYRHHAIRLEPHNIGELVAGHDLVIDATDNFATRFLVADACWLQKTPLLQGSVYQYGSQVMLFVPERSPCYRCVFGGPPEPDALQPCSEIGVLGVIAGTTGLLMATEAIKYLAGIGETVAGSLLRYNGLKQEVTKLKLQGDKNCPLCGASRSIYSVQ